MVKATSYLKRSVLVLLNALLLWKVVHCQLIQNEVENIKSCTASIQLGIHKATAEYNWEIKGLFYYFDEYLTKFRSAFHLISQDVNFKTEQFEGTWKFWVSKAAPRYLRVREDTTGIFVGASYTFQTPCPKSTENVTMVKNFYQVNLQIMYKDKLKVEESLISEENFIYVPDNHNCEEKTYSYNWGRDLRELIENILYEVRQECVQTADGELFICEKPNVADALTLKFTITALAQKEPEVVSETCAVHVNS